MCPRCGARWYGYLTFCWCCDWERGDLIRRLTANQRKECKRKQREDANVAA